MKVKIYYHIPKVIECEVDDHFKVLTEDGGWKEKSYKELERVAEELCEVAEELLEDDSSLLAIHTTDGEVLVEC